MDTNTGTDTQGARFCNAKIEIITFGGFKYFISGSCNLRLIFLLRNTCNQSDIAKLIEKLFFSHTTPLD